MIYIDNIKLPSKDEVDKYINKINVYPWNIFFENEFECMILKDITILYGNNGSGKSTVLNLIADKIKAQRNTDFFKDINYIMGEKINPFDDFVDKIQIEMGYDDNEEIHRMPRIRKLITSDGIFKKIDGRTKHNQKSIIQNEEARHKKSEILEKGYTYRSLEDYEELGEYIEARKLSKRKYAELHSIKKEKMLSNGETALSIFENAFESGGIYLLDEPENCLSSIFQIELIKLIQESVKYFDCQFIICTHSPLLLSLKNALIYNLDARPVVTEKWNELENVRIYFDFFKKHKDDFSE